MTRFEVLSCGVGIGGFVCVCVCVCGGGDMRELLYLCNWRKRWRLDASFMESRGRINFPGADISRPDEGRETRGQSKLLQWEEMLLL